MDHRNWDMRTPWKAVGSTVYNADGDFVAECVPEGSAYTMAEVSEASAKASLIAMAVNALADIGVRCDDLAAAIGKDPSIVELLASGMLSWVQHNFAAVRELKERQEHPQMFNDE